MKKSDVMALVCAVGMLAAPVFARAQMNANADIEARVRTAFVDTPGMIEIAKCESGFRQFGPDGAVLRGGNNRGYLGIFQIGEALHAARGLAKGMDITTVEGNIAYAKTLYAASGVNPWLDCIKRPPPAVSTNGTFTVNLRLGMRHPDVRKLQERLNALGFAVAASGPGSAGQETELFGQLTREAVRRFQCAKLLICEGTETTTGYGRVGPMTRAALNP